MNASIDIHKPPSWFLPVFFGMAALLLLTHLNHFMVPDSDFFDYAEKAAQLRQLQWPDSFKRPPLYPLLIAAVSALMPGKYAELYAAEIIGIISALVAFYFLWRIAARLAPRAAPYVLWIWAFHPLTVRMALKPKPEMLVTCLILWAFERHLRGDRRAYAVACLASMVRYEGALAIGAFFLVDFLLTRHKWRTLLVASVSSLFIVAWSLLQGGDAPAGGDYASYFTDYRLNFGFLYIFSSDLLSTLPIHFFKLWFVLATAGFICGAVYLWQSHRSYTAAALIYLLGYWLLHIIWPFSGSDYLVMATWTAVMFIIPGWGALLKRLLPYVKSTRPAKVVGKFSGYTPAIYILTAVAVGVWLAGVTFPYPQYQPRWSWVFLAVLPLSLHHWPQAYTLRNAAKFILIFSGLIWVSFFFNSRLRNDLYELYYAKAEFRLVGEWYEKNYRRGDRLLMAQPNIAAYFTSLEYHDFVPLTEAPQCPPEEWGGRLREQGITRVAYLKYNLMTEQEIPWSKWVAKHRNLDGIAFLKEGKDFPGLRCEAILRSGPRWAYIYKVTTEAPEWKQSEK